MGVSKDGKGSEKPPVLSGRDSAGETPLRQAATVSAAAGGVVSGDSSADSALPGGNAAVMAAAGGAGGAVSGGSAADSALLGGSSAAAAADDAWDEWDFDRKAQALQAELFDLKGLIPGALRDLDNLPRQKGKVKHFWPPLLTCLLLFLTGRPAAKSQERGITEKIHMA
jgi:hypothetical protein